MRISQLVFVFVLFMCHAHVSFCNNDTFDIVALPEFESGFFLADLMIAKHFMKPFLS